MQKINLQNIYIYLKSNFSQKIPLTLYDPSINVSETGVPNGVENLNHNEILSESLTEEERTWGDIASGDNANNITFWFRHLLIIFI